MKPVAFDYACPMDLDEAITLLRQAGAFVKILAGGQSLGPMLNLRLVQPDLLVDLRGIPALDETFETAESVTIGAGVTHAAIEDGKVPDPTNGMLRYVASRIAYRAIRNRGTIGGSLAHADPAADWVSTLAVLGASVSILSSNGPKTLGIDAFQTGTFATALGDDEIMQSITIPRLSDSARWGYFKYCRKVGEFAEVLAAVVRDPARNIARAALGGKNSSAIVIQQADAVFAGDKGTKWTVDQVAPHATEDQAHLYRIALRRAVAGLR